MTEQEKEDLIWGCIQPAEMGCAPEMSDGYNEGEVYSTCCRIINKLLQGNVLIGQMEYNRLVRKAENVKTTDK